MQQKIIICLCINLSMCLFFLYICFFLVQYELNVKLNFLFKTNCCTTLSSKKLKLLLELPRSTSCYDIEELKIGSENRIETANVASARTCAFFRTMYHKDNYVGVIYIGDDRLT